MNNIQRSFLHFRVSFCTLYVLRMYNNTNGAFVYTQIHYNDIIYLSLEKVYYRELYLPINIQRIYKHHKIKGSITAKNSGNLSFSNLKYKTYF